MDMKSQSRSSDSRLERQISANDLNIHQEIGQPHGRVSKGGGVSRSDDDKTWSAEGNVHDHNVEPANMDTFGTSGPRASFLPTDRKQDRSDLSFRTARSSLSFRTARSSLARYVTASSNLNTVQFDPAHSSGDVLPVQRWISRSHESAEASQIWNLIAALIQRLDQSPEMACLHISDPHQELPALRDTIRMELIRHLGSNRSAPSLDHAIQGVVRVFESLNPAYIDAVKVNGNDIKLDVAVEIYMYALKCRHLRHLVPSGVFTDGEMTKSEWILHLHSRGLLPTEAQALDWSGRGQHAEYLPDEEQLIPLVEGKVLGHSMSAVVQSVKCRRIQLARKTIRCNKRFTKQMAVTEVAHLQLVQHRHIIRLVGTYTFKRDLAILLYPVATWNLDEFLDECTHDTQNADAQGEIWRFSGCLVRAMAYIHAQNVKHMDIKPGNILVRMVKGEYRAYIADFGIARAYKSAEASNTDSPTSFTPIYAAPEVVTQDKRGYSADIFSLGCVFLEIVEATMHVYSCPPEQSLSAVRIGNRSYSANLDHVHKWCDEVLAHQSHPWRIWVLTRDWIPVIKNMLNVDPQKRPSAYELSGQMMFLGCGRCQDGPEPFEATPPPPLEKKDTSVYLQE